MGPREIIGSDPVFTASEFVAVFNQSLEITFPRVSIIGELANLRINRGRWVYFDLKDDESSIKFFGTTTHLPGPLEDGLMLEVRGRPRLHPKFGFSINVDVITVSGKGSIRKAQDLLAQKLMSEGLFEESRKRALPYPPSDIGVISAKDSAAVADFRKIIDARWGSLRLRLLDTQVQGADSPKQIVDAIQTFNQLADAPEVLVLIRGGGSADDLAAFSTEQVVRAVAASRIPTLVAIGHEVDVSLAELAADRRASTPSNAAEMLVPDAKNEAEFMTSQVSKMNHFLYQIYTHGQKQLLENKQSLTQNLNTIFSNNVTQIASKAEILKLLDPKLPLKRGFALVRNGQGAHVRFVKGIKGGDKIHTELVDGIIESDARKVTQV